MLDYHEGMQVTVEIPDPLYQQLEAHAQRLHSTVQEVLLDAAHRALPEAPLSSRLHLTAAEAGPLVDLDINLDDIISLEDPDIVRLHEVLKTSAEDAVQEYGLHDSEEDR